MARELARQEKLADVIAIAGGDMPQLPVQELEDKEERQLHREVTHLGGELQSMRRVLLDLNVESYNAEMALEHVHWQVDSFDAVKAMHSTQFHLLQLMAQTEVLKDLLQTEKAENEHVDSFVRLALADLEASGPNSFLLEASSVDLLETLTACYINQGSGYTPLARISGMGFGAATAGHGDEEEEEENEEEGERGRYGHGHGGRYHGDDSVAAGSRGGGSGRRSSSNASSRRVARSHSTNSAGLLGGASRSGHTDLGSGFEGEGEGSSGGGSPAAGIGGQGARAGLALVSERVKSRSLRRHRSRHSDDGFDPSRLGGSPGRYSPGHAALELVGSGSPPLGSNSPPLASRSFTHHGGAASKLSQEGPGGTGGGYADDDDDGSVGSEDEEEYQRLLGLEGSEMQQQLLGQQQQQQQSLVRRSATAPIKTLRSGASPGLTGGLGSTKEREVRKSGSDEAEEGGRGRRRTGGGGTVLPVMSRLLDPDGILQPHESHLGESSLNASPARSGDPSLDPMAQLPGLTPSMLLSASRSPDRPRPAPRPRPPISKFASSPTSALNSSASPFSSSIAGVGADRPSAAALGGAGAPAPGAGGAGGAAGPYPSHEPMPSAIPRTRSAGPDFLEQCSAGAGGPVAGLAKAERSRERPRSGSGGKGEGGGARGGSSRAGSWGSAGSLGELMGEEDLEAFMDYESQGGSGTDVRRRTRAGRGGVLGGERAGGGGGGEGGGGGREGAVRRERSLGEIFDSVVSSSEAEMADKRRDRWRRSKDKILRSKGRRSDKAGAAAASAAGGASGAAGGFGGKHDKAHGTEADFYDEFDEVDTGAEEGRRRPSMASVDSLSRWNSVPDDWIDLSAPAATAPAAAAAEQADQQWDGEREKAGTAITAAAVAAAAEGSPGEELLTVESAPALFVGFQAGAEDGGLDSSSRKPVPVTGVGLTGLGPEDGRRTASSSPPSAAAAAAGAGPTSSSAAAVASASASAAGGGAGGGAAAAAAAVGGGPGLSLSVSRTRSAEGARAPVVGHRSARSISDMPPRIPRTVSLADETSGTYGGGAGSVPAGGSAAAAAGGSGAGAGAGAASAAYIRSSGLRKALAKSISQKLARNKTRTPSRTTSNATTATTSASTPLTLELEDLRVRPCELSEEMLRSIGAIYLSHAYPALWGAGEGRRAAALLASEQKRVATDEKIEKILDPTALEVLAVSSRSSPGGKKVGGGVRTRKKSEDPWDVVAAALGSVGPGGAGGGESGAGGICLSPQPITGSGSGSSQGETGGSGSPQYYSQSHSQHQQYQQHSPLSPGSNATTPSAAAAAAAAGSPVTASPSVTSSPSSFSSLASASSLPSSSSSLPSSSYSSIRKGEAGSRSRRASGAAAVPATPRTAWLRASLAVFQNAEKCGGAGGVGGGGGGGEVGGYGDGLGGELGGIAGSGAVAAGLQYSATRSNSYGSGSGYGSSGSFRGSTGAGGSGGGAGGAAGGAGGGGGGATAAGAGAAGALFSSAADPSSITHASTDHHSSHTITRTSSTPAFHTSGPFTTPASSSAGAAAAFPASSSPFLATPAAPMGGGIAVGSAANTVEGFVDPYGVLEFHPCPPVGAYGAAMEVTAVPSDDKYSNVDIFSLCRYRMLAEQLSDLDPSYLSEDEKLAFWLNLYNALLLHSFLINGYPTTHAKRISMLSQATFIIGNLPINALEIEFAVLRAPTYRSSLAKALKSRPFAYDDPRVAWALTVGEPNVSFGLCPGSFCAPALRVYSARSVHAELEEAKDNFLEVAIGMSRDDRIILPKILDWYCPDFTDSLPALLEWALNQLPPAPRVAIAKRMAQKRNPTIEQCVEVASYDWSFRYLLDPRSLTIGSDSF
ncbi:hypothetical protein CLOM_g13421 [Closterium sp. NIES-68]|nr:hypothetical protein CLOM_g13421 [Closterium sp. NIES-68]GJP72435.1 hypothetical protein CLOP_g3167 [Closterium sp. NIES-67]